MKKLLVPVLAAVLVVAVGFVLVELHAPLSPSSDTRTPDTRTPGAPPPGPPSAHAGAFATPGAPPAKGPPRPERPPTLPPVPSGSAGVPDPGDVVIDGRTRRQWHAYYAERQRQMTVEMLRYQTIIDRAIAGEEPDPKELGEAHDHVAEIKGRMKQDLEALQRIDATP